MTQISARSLITIEPQCPHDPAHKVIAINGAKRLKNENPGDLHERRRYRCKTCKRPDGTALTFSVRVIVETDRCATESDDE